MLGAFTLLTRAKWLLAGMIYEIAIGSGTQSLDSSWVTFDGSLTTSMLIVRGRPGQTMLRSLGRRRELQTATSAATPIMSIGGGIMRLKDLVFDGEGVHGGVEITGGQVDIESCTFINGAGALRIKSGDHTHEDMMMVVVFELILTHKESEPTFEVESMGGRGFS